MLYVIHGLDKPQSPLRAQLLEEHRQYLADSPVRVVSSGPLLSDPGGQMIGSVVIVDCADRLEVDALMAAEPFNRAGLYQSLHINLWHQRTGDIGGGTPGVLDDSGAQARVEAQPTTA